MLAAGFTLLEAMVALVIVALGMMAVNGQLNRYAVAAKYVEAKTLASWIATNEITALSVGHHVAGASATHDEDVEFARPTVALRRSKCRRRRSHRICIASTYRSHSRPIPSASCTKSRALSSRLPRRHSYRASGPPPRPLARLGRARMTARSREGSAASR